MDSLSRVLRVATAAVLCAVTFRLFSQGLPETLAALLSESNISAFLTQLETGRNVRFSPSLAAFSPHFVESPPAAMPEPAPEPTLPVYEAVPSVWNQSGVEADLAALLEAPLEWKLLTAEPTVLILHTHTTESYTQTDEPYVEVSSWRTLDAHYNMRSIGAEVGRLLTEAGISVVLEDTVHDYPGYNGSYVRARKTIRQALEQYPSIRLVLDLHRDASAGETGQLRTLAQRDSQTAAQIMPVVGTNHEGYEENLSLALKLSAQLERQWPGITRPLQLRSSRFNQDLHPAALLVEVGAAGNTHTEALTAARELAKAIIALSNGTAIPPSPRGEG